MHSFSAVDVSMYALNMTLDECRTTVLPRSSAASFRPVVVGDVGTRTPINIPPSSDP